jgi:hypothetical protein
MKKVMSSGELECLIEQISTVLEECPLYYVIEVLEGAKSYRDRMGEQDELDVSSDEEDYNPEEPCHSDSMDEEEKEFDPDKSSSSSSESDG